MYQLSRKDNLVNSVIVLHGIFFPHLKFRLNKCDAIKQNESDDVDKNRHTVFISFILQFDIYEIQKTPKQYNTKEIGCYYWLYLKININKFRLILLDHITYEISVGCRRCGSIGIYWVAVTSTNAYYRLYTRTRLLQHTNCIT